MALNKSFEVSVFALEAEELHLRLCLLNLLETSVITSLQNEAQRGRFLQETLDLIWTELSGR